MPYLKKYHGGAIGTMSHEVTQGEYDAARAEYDALRRDLEAAVADPERADRGTLEAADKCLDLGFSLEVADLDALRRMRDAAAAELGRRRAAEDAERRNRWHDAAAVVRAAEEISKAVAELDGIALDPEDMGPRPVPARLDPAAFAGADLNRAAIGPEIASKSCEDDIRRYDAALKALADGIPAATRKRAGAVIRELRRRAEARKAASDADLEAIEAERRRRADLEAEEERRRREAERLPETMEDLRARVAELEARLAR